MNPKNIINKERNKERYSKNKEYFKEYRLKNREHVLERKKEYYLKNKERKKEYYLKNKEHILEQKKEYYLKNKEQIEEYRKEYRSRPEIKEHYKKYLLKNREHILEQKRKLYYKTREQRKEYRSRPEIKEGRRNRLNNKYKTDINFRILTVCRTRTLRALKGFTKSASTMELIGCTPDKLRRHIESKFEPWMTWENQGLGGWDIDHIKACANFDLTDPEEQHACFHWSNLQPLEHIENIRKGAK